MNAQNSSSHEYRISVLEDDMTLALKQLSELKHSMDENTRVTAQTHSELSDFISLIKGGKTLGKVIAWATTVTAGLGIVYAAGKHFFHTGGGH
jgi:hypothetical protein